MSKKTVAILFGGKSAEHEVSLMSAKNVIEAIDREVYDVALIGVDKQGAWHLLDEVHYLDDADDAKNIRLHLTGEAIAVIPGQDSAQIINSKTNEPIKQIDVVFPVIHGTLGEDGSLQGLVRTLNLPFVGVDLLGSAVSMDKDFTKRLLKERGLKVAAGLVFKVHEQASIDFSAVKATLGLPVFIKPANQGSSVGVSKATDEASFTTAIQDAFLYDDKVLVEEAVKGREVECAVLGNAVPKASVIGEILPQTDFYSYESKYIDESGAVLSAPADLTPEQVEQIQTEAVRVFQTLDCEGMARVDFFLKEDDTLIINEVNTIPGFTKISMYPRLWTLSGLSYPDLIDTLIKLAFERHERKQHLKSARD
ncbi:MAG: D-alanine--D-alanine ligase [Bacillota bacterium]